MEGDTVYVIARQDAVKEVMEFSGQSNVEIKNMMILGGSRIGIRIATELQDEVNIKLIDYNAEKAYRLAEIVGQRLSSSMRTAATPRRCSKRGWPIWTPSWP